MSPENSFVLGFLQGKYHNKKKPQSCENWFQVEVAKALSTEYPEADIALEGASDNSDIVLRRKDGDDVHIEIKINPSNSGVKRDRNKLKKTAEGYLLLLLPMKDRLKKYKDDKEQFLDRSVIRSFGEGISNKIYCNIIPGNVRIAIGCLRIDRTH